MSRQTKRIVGIVPETLPYPEYMALAQEMASAMPLTVVEDGITFYANDIKFRVIGMLTFALCIYTDDQQGQS